MLGTEPTFGGDVGRCGLPIGRGKGGLLFPTANGNPKLDFLARTVKSCKPRYYMRYSETQSRLLNKLSSCAGGAHHFLFHCPEGGGRRPQPVAPNFSTIFHPVQNQLLSDRPILLKIRNADVYWIGNQDQKHPLAHPHGDRVIQTPAK